MQMLRERSRWSRSCARAPQPARDEYVGRLERRPGSAWRVVALALMAAWTVAHAAALAQPAVTAPPAAHALPSADQVLVIRPLPDALADAAAQGRVLLVEIAGNEQRQKEALARYASPLVRRWVRDHALGVLLTDRAMIKTLTENDLNPGPDADPLVFQNGKQVRVFGSGVPQKKSRLRGPARPGEAFVGLVLKLDWTLRGREDAGAGGGAAGGGAGGGVGGEAAGVRPAPALLCDVEDEHAVRVPDPRPGEAGGLGLVLARVQEARAAVKAGGGDNLRRAAGLYTWLWERAVAQNPSVQEGLWLVIAPEMEALAAVHPGALERWRAIRRAQLEVLNVRDERALFAFMVLSRVIGDQEENFRFLDDALNDVDAARLMPRIDRTLLELWLPVCHWLPSGATDQAARLDKLGARGERAAAALPAGAQARARAAWAWLMRVERVRTYITLLARDQSDAAQALATAWDADARQSAVIAALLLGEARAAQRELLKGCPSEHDIVQAVEAALAAAPKPTPGPSR